MVAAAGCRASADDAAPAIRVHPFAAIRAASSGIRALAALRDNSLQDGGAVAVGRELEMGCVRVLCSRAEAAGSRAPAFPPSTIRPPSSAAHWWRVRTTLDPRRRVLVQQRMAAVVAVRSIRQR